MFSSLTEAQLRNRLEPEKGIFIAESPKVIRVALNAGYEPLALLCEPKHIEGDAADIIACHTNLPIYTGERELLSLLTGYALTRGVLCAFRRPMPKSIEDVCRNARRIVVIQGVTDTTNIGAIFRSAAALGMDAQRITDRGATSAPGTRRAATSSGSRISTRRTVPASIRRSTSCADIFGTSIIPASLRYWFRTTSCSGIPLP